jgi:hypothetical protein
MNDRCAVLILRIDSVQSFLQADEDSKKDMDNFLVCVFNVSSKVSYTILQVPKTSTSADVIAMALAKSRNDDGEADKQADKFVLVEETDDNNGASAGPTGSLAVSKKSARGGPGGTGAKVGGVSV